MASRGETLSYTSRTEPQGLHTSRLPLELMSTTLAGTAGAPAKVLAASTSFPFPVGLVGNVLYTPNMVDSEQGLCRFFGAGAADSVAVVSIFGGELRQLGSHIRQASTGADTSSSRAQPVAMGWEYLGQIGLTLGTGSGDGVVVPEAWSRVDAITVIEDAQPYTGIEIVNQAANGGSGIIVDMLGYSCLAFILGLADPVGGEAATMTGVGVGIRQL